MSDLIDRQDALDAIQQRSDRVDSVHSAFWEGLIIAYSLVQDVPSAEPEQTLESAIDYLHSVGWLQEHDRILTESAEPEPKWIPVTEALPEEDIDVLLQFPKTMGVGYQEDGYWNIVTGADIYSGVDEADEKPIAWMPLPEPWRGE